MSGLTRENFLEIRFDCLKDIVDSGHFQIFTICCDDQRQWMDLHLISQGFNGADTGNLVPLLNATDVAEPNGTAASGPSPGWRQQRP